MVMTPEVAREKYLLKHYATTTAEYNARFELQGGVCKICGRTPAVGGRPLHVDHDHKVAALKVVAKMVVAKVWISTVAQFGMIFNGVSRDDVKKQAKFWLLHKSVRGLICWSCNTGLKKFYDNPNALRSAGSYLDEFKVKLYTK